MTVNNKLGKTLGRVGVIMGGVSAEREVSLVTGKAAYEALLANNIDAVLLDVKEDAITQIQAAKIDRAFIALHAGWGENGGLQGALEVLGIPYTGSNVLACAIAMDKPRCKWLWQGLSLPTPEFYCVNSLSECVAAAERIGLPVCVKPSAEGSSLGVSKISNIDQLANAWKLARDFSLPIMVEKWIEGTEFTVGILGERALPTIRIEASEGFYDYAAKYTAHDTQYIIPCGLSDAAEKELQELSFQAYHACACRHWGRVDVMQAKDGQFWLIEVNTVPGLVPDHSLVPMAAKAVGLEFPDLVTAILTESLNEV